MNKNNIFDIQLNHLAHGCPTDMSGNNLVFSTAQNEIDGHLVLPSSFIQLSLSLFTTPALRKTDY